MNKTFLKIFALLCAVVQGAWAWEGSGTESDPYLIKRNVDWWDLDASVRKGNNYKDQFFRLANDLDTEGLQVGTEDKPFCGTFDGDGHTLTFEMGITGNGMEEWINHVDDYCAPFVRLDGATIRHLKVKGRVFSKKKFAAGIVSFIDGDEPTTIYDCHVSNKLYAHSDLFDDATYGGLVGVVSSTCKASPTIERCSFTGYISANRSSGIVGYAHIPVIFKHCLMSPSETIRINGGATFVRLPDNVACTMEECYYTQTIGVKQGEGVFSIIYLPDGCTYSVESGNDITFNGKTYYKNGTWIWLTAPDDMPFDHWDSYTNCQISNPWGRNGRHQINDILGIPVLHNATSMPKAKMERTMDGTRYRYLGVEDYRLYFSDSYCAQKGYYIDNKGWLVRNINGTEVYVTAVVGWVGGKIPSDGAQIHNDLVGDWRDHSLMGCIAPGAFKGCTELKTLYFKDTDANNYNTKCDFDFTIGEEAFADCPNLTEVKMMQYTTRGDNHWEALRPDQVGYVASDVFSGSLQARFSTDAGEYQNYMGNATWKPLHNHIIVYNHTDVDFSVNGARYSQFRNTAGEEQKNTPEGHETMMQTLRLWNGIYHNFNAVSLLAEPNEQNIWYTQVVGADDDYLKSNNGAMRIYNDPGSYYNYKTLTIVRNAFKDNKNLRSIEFWQTNGRSDNSYSDLKIVIQNGAFTGCDNLKELRLFYYEEDGEDHWTTLSPTDVIPGDNIFGIPTAEEAMNMTEEELENAYKIPKDFKIMVSTAFYPDFLSDPNWIPYTAFIEPVEFDPDSKHEGKTFTMDKLTYGYMTSPGGIAKTYQTVTTNFSWWSILKIAYNIYSYATMAKGLAMAVHTAREAAKKSAEIATEQTIRQSAQTMLVNTTDALASDQAAASVGRMLTELAEQNATLETIGIVGNAPLAQSLTQWGVLNAAGQFTAGAGELSRQALLRTAYVLKYELSKTVANQVTKINSIIFNAGVKGFFEESFKSGGKTALSFLGINGGFGIWNSIDYFGKPGVELYIEKGMRANIQSNMHKWGSAGGGWVYFSPSKHLVYHTYIKSASDDITDAVIYTTRSDKEGYHATSCVASCAKDAFRNKKQLKTISFHDNEGSSNTSMPLQFSFPDSAFVGCTALEELNLLLKDGEGNTRPLGPENFVLCGDNVFAGLDPEKFHIVIDSMRKQDFLDNETWAPLEPYFSYRSAHVASKFEEYGVGYAYVYDGNSIKKEHKEGAHLIEHTSVNSCNDDYLNKHSGTAVIINDIGTYNNYQAENIAPWAFQGKDCLKNVQFIDLKGWGPYGQCYTGLDITLRDSCFANCKNLESVDLLYGITDQPDFLTQIGSGIESNHIDPMTPQMIKIGKGVFEGSPKVKLKMMERQLEWFKADENWAAYQNLFFPCVFTSNDDGVRAALEDLRYYNPSGASPDYWADVFDVSRVLDKEGGFNWLNGKFTTKKDKLRTFHAFKTFETVGLDFVGDKWFADCNKLNHITLPKTIKRIGKEAFLNCSTLEQIELPEGVENIQDAAFKGCSGMKVIMVNNPSPCNLTGADHFPLNAELRIYVPDEAVETYVNHPQWKKYKEYIVGRSRYKVNKVITVTKSGQLASKLGLTLQSEHPFGDHPYDETVRYVHGNYLKYDSLTIQGPLNGTDIIVLRYLAGSDSWNVYDTDTEGQLKYLNLYSADFEKDNIQPCSFYAPFWRYTKEDNYMVEYMFGGCKALETVILPRSLKKILYNPFKGCKNLKKLAFCNVNQMEYGLHYEEGIVKWVQEAIGYGSLVDNTLDELVLYTEKLATCTTVSDPWKNNINYVFTLPDKVADYQGQPTLVNRTRSISSLFADRAVIDDLVSRNQFFPSDYLQLENVENYFSGDSNLKTFDEFYMFTKVKKLDRTFTDCTALTTITLPGSLKYISSMAFSGCMKLAEVHISTDSIPYLEENAFEDQVKALKHDFHIYVPKKLCPLYREKWSQYADYINVDYFDYSTEDIMVVKTEKPNQLAELLGLKVTLKEGMVYDSNAEYDGDDRTKLHATWITGLTGIYDHIQKLKIIGPISGLDLSVLRFLAGFCPWAGTRNYTGHLEYLDLYDADLKETDGFASQDKSLLSQGHAIIRKENVLPPNSFLKCYNLKTLILPRSCTKVQTRALMSCENLEVLVVGDNCTEFNWSALDDNAMLTRLYLLAKEKPKLTIDGWVTRMLSNNYNPTFDAIYVCPSVYPQYLMDPAYTSTSWQRTNLISHGEFNDDDSFRAFAAHAAATIDDISDIENIEGWFNSHPNVKNLTPLRYSIVDSISRATMAPLTQLEEIAMPVTIMALEDNLFENAKKLHYVDFLMCDSTDLVNNLHGDGLKRIGIDTQRTFVYMPPSYGESDGTNIVATEGNQLHAKAFRMIDSLDYIVPYSFDADRIENSRALPTSAIPYTFCVPYKMNVPAYARAYALSERDGNTLVFKEVTGELEAMRPYLLKVVGNKRMRKNSATLNTDISQTIPSNGVNTMGKQDNTSGYALRGTFESIDNQTAAELGAYILQSDGDWHPVASSTDAEKKAAILPFRAFLLPRAYSANSRISMTLEDATDIESFETIDEDGTHRFYDLNGRELPGKPANGIYIHKGKKYMAH